MTNLEDSIFDPNDDDSEFAHWNAELASTRFASVYGLAEYLLFAVAGLDPGNPQEADTPKRFVNALRELTTPDTTWKFTTFDAESDEMVTMYNIPFHSLCRHHVLPFQGVAHIAYVPDKLWAGASKLPRTVAHFSARLQTQEELTAQIAEYLGSKLLPKGVAVVMEAEHTCMTLRGVRTYGTRMRTATVTGVFADHEKTAKAEFFSGINGR